MLRFFARLSIGIAVILCLFVGTIRLIGASIPPPGLETLQQFDCTPKPCWHRIHLGVTSATEAASILKSDKTISLIDYLTDSNSVCWNWQNQFHGNLGWDGCYHNDPKLEYGLTLRYMNSPLRLGDLIRLTGRPSSSVLCTNTHSGVLSSHTIAMYVDVPNNQSTIDPEFIVQQIYYLDPDINQDRSILNLGSVHSNQPQIEAMA